MCVWQRLSHRIGTVSSCQTAQYHIYSFDQTQPSPMRMMDLRSPLWSLCTVQFCVGLSIRNSPKLETIYHVSWLMVTLSANWVITKGRLVLLALKTFGFLCLWWLECDHVFDTGACICISQQSVRFPWGATSFQLIYVLDLLLNWDWWCGMI